MTYMLFQMGNLGTYFNNNQIYRFKGSYHAHEKHMTI